MSTPYIVTVLQPQSSSSLVSAKIEWNGVNFWVRREEISSSTSLYLQSESGGEWKPHTDFPQSHFSFLSHLSSALSSSLLGEEGLVLNISHFVEEDSTLSP